MIQTYLFHSRFGQMGIALILASIMFFTSATLASAQTSSISDLRARIVALQEQVALLQQLLAVQQQLAALTESGEQGGATFSSALQAQISQGSEGLQELYGTYQDLVQRYNRYTDIFPEVDSATQESVLQYIEEIEEVLTTALNRELQGDVTGAQELQQSAQSLLNEADVTMALFEERMLPQSEITQVLANRLHAIGSLIERNRQQMMSINIESLEELYADAELELRQVFILEQTDSIELDSQIERAEVAISDVETLIRSTVSQYRNVDLQGLSGGLQGVIRTYIDVELDFVQKIELLETVQFESVNGLLDEARLQIDLAIAIEMQGSQTMAAGHVQTARSILEDIERMLVVEEVQEEDVEDEVDDISDDTGDTEDTA